VNVCSHIQHLEGFILRKNVYAFLSAFAPDLTEVAPNIQARPNEICEIMRQLFTGLQTLHKNKIIHRDIKQANLLWDGVVLTIVDFDSATWDTEQGHHDCLGTPGLMAPEVSRYERDGPHPPVPYGTKIDMYSSGIVFGCLLFGVPEDDLTEMHASAFRDCAKRLLPEHTALLLKQLLHFNPVMRISADQALESSYFQKCSAITT